MSKFSKNGNLMVYSNDVCGEEGGAEEFLAAVVIPEGPDRGKMEEPIPVPLHLTSSAKKDFDSDDVGLKLSDLPDDYFDDLLDLDLDEPAKKPEVCQLVQIENGKPDYDSECSEPEEVKPDASAEENFLPIITTKPIEGLVEFENSDAPCDLNSANKVVGQREKLKITFNKKFVKTKYTRVSRLNLLKSLFGDDEDDDMALPITIEKNAIELMCKRNKICENRKDTEHEEMKIVKVDEEKTDCEPLCSETCMKKDPTCSPIKKETETSTLKCSYDEMSFEEVKKYSYENIPSKQDSPKEEQRKQKSLSPSPQKPDEIKEQEWSSSRKRNSSSPATRSISKKKKAKKEKSKSKKTKKKSRKDRSTSPISKPESVKPSEAKIDDSTKMSSWKDSVEKFLQQSGQSKHIKTSPALPPSPPTWNNLIPPQNYNMIRAMNCLPHPQMVNFAAGYMPSANFHWQGYPPPHFMFGQGPGYRPVIFSNGLPVPTDVSSQNLHRSPAPIQVKEPATNSPPVGKAMMSGIGVGSSPEMKDTQCNLNHSDFPATLPSLLLAEGKNATTSDGKVTAEQNSEQVENSTAKKFTEASTSTDFLLPLTISGNQQTLNQDMIPETVPRSKTHSPCLSKSVQLNSLCQDCSDKTQIIANVRKFAECMLAKNVHSEAMTVLLQMIEPGTQNSNPDGFQPANIDDIVDKIRSKEIFKAITYRKWHANIYNCTRKPLAEATNPSLDSKSTPENQEATVTAAAVNPKCSGDLGKSPVKANGMQMVPRKNRRPRKRFTTASCETQPVLANEGETLTKSTDSALSHLPSYADAIVQFTLLNHTKVDATQKSGTEKGEEKCKQQVEKQPEVQSTSPGIEMEVRESAEKTLQRKPGSGERPHTANRTTNYPRPEPSHADQHFKMRSNPTRARQVRMRERNFSDNIPHNDGQWRMRRIPYYESPPSDFRERRPEFRCPEEEFHFNERLRFNDCQPYYRDDYLPPRYSDGW